MAERKKTKFFRRDWHKRIKFGKTVKKKRKWRAAKGIHNKVRLGEKGYPSRPKIGYGKNKNTKNMLGNFKPITIYCLKDMESLKKGESIIISKVGQKKREEIIKKAEEKGIIILNKYRKNKNESSK